MTTSTCPYCSHPLLRHVRSRQIYWFCNHCYQEMPYSTRSLDNLKTSINLSCNSNFAKVNLVQ